MLIHQEEMNIRQRELLAEAEKYRLISKFKRSSAKQKPIYPRTMAWLGSQMVILGIKLTSRYGEQAIIVQSGSGKTQIQGSH